MARVRPFAVLFSAETQSIIGDQLARVALSILVFRQTASATATALTYAATYLPVVVGGLVLARIGDALPRRSVMIVTDLIRAALFAVMVVPGFPLSGVVALVIVSVFLGPAFAASEVAYLARALAPEEFRVGNGLRMFAAQASQVLGFAVGGILVAATSPRTVLAIDAVTFVLSALLIAFGLSRDDTRLDAAGRADVDQVGSTDERAFRGVWRETATRRWMILMTVVGLFVIPEALAVPFGGELGISVPEIGVLLAALPIGGAVGATIVIKLHSLRTMRPLAGLAVLCGVPLLASAAYPPWPIVWVCWFASGVFAAYQVNVVTHIVSAIPDHVRARHIGALSAWLLGAQGLGFVAGGAAARVWGTGTVIAVGAGAGSLIAVAILATTGNPPGRGGW